MHEQIASRTAPIYGVKWEQSSTGFTIFIPFPWGYISSAIHSFSPHYAVGKTLPVYDSVFWMWSATGFAHFQLRDVSQSFLFHSWEKSFSVAVDDSYQAILQIAKDLEHEYVKAGKH